MTHSPIRALLITGALCAAAVAASAQGSAKDIVLDRIGAQPAGRPAPAASTSQDVLAVSVLLESSEGALIPKPVTTLFSTGDRFRVKLLAAREGKVSLYNTTPRGEFKPQPVWQGEVKPGQETITPRLRLDGQSGTDLLHVVLEPEQPSQGLMGWLTRWLTKEGSAAPKDIRLDSEDTASASYLVNQGGQGLVATVRIRHR